jgi:hypothetical protein
MLKSAQIAPREFSTTAILRFLAAAITAHFFFIQVPFAIYRHNFTSISVVTAQSGYVDHSELPSSSARARVAVLSGVLSRRDRRPRTTQRNRP